MADALTSLGNGRDMDLFWTAPFMAYSTAAVGAGLLEFGHQKGSVVGTWCQSSIELLMTVLGAAQVGAVVAALPTTASVQQVQEVLASEQVRTLLFDERVGQTSQLDALVGLLPELTEPSSLNWLNLKRFRALRQVVNVTSDEVHHGLLSFRSVPVYDPMPHPVPLIQRHLHADDAVLRPFAQAADGKLARQDDLSWTAIHETATALAKEVDLGEHDRILITAPVTSRAGIAAVAAGIHTGAKLVFAGRGFKADTVGAIAGKQRPTVIVADGAHAEAAGSAVSAADGGVAALRAVVVAASGSAAPAGTWGKVKPVVVNSDAMASADKAWVKA